ncbi:MAG: tetratricopeptide repeat protein, partial [Chryseosolibacter sp.]
MKAIVDTPDKVSQVDIFYELGYQFIDVDNNEALKYANMSYTLASGLQDSLRVVKAILIQGSALRRMERLDEAISVSLKGLGVAKRNHFDTEFKILLNSIAIAYSLKAEYDKALDFHYQSLIIREMAGNKSEISIALNNIGFVYFKLRNYEQAVEYFNRSLILRREVNDAYDLDRLLVNLGTCHIHLGHFEKAVDFIEEGLSLCKANCNDQIRLEGLFSLGVSNFGLRNFDEAKIHFQQSLGIAKNINNIRFQAENSVYLGKIALQNRAFQHAEQMLLDAESLAKKSGYNQLLLDSYKQFSILYNDQKDFERAAVNQRKYIGLKDSLIGEDLVINIAKIQTKFQERVNLQTIADREETIARQRAMNIAVAIIAVLAGALIFVLYHSIKVK